MKLATGTIVDQRFRVVGELGAGGMAIVYRAEQLGFDRTVALKVMHLPSIKGSNERKRFLREARLLSRLSHPSICQFYHCGLTPEGFPYIAMELCSGRTLRSLIADEPLDWQTAVRIMSQVAEALRFAHENSTVHRDLSPQNILVADDGKVKIIDFGLATSQNPTEDTITATGAIVGTVHYLSPEQAAGQKAQLQSDVYSFGCILFEILSGLPPYSADTAIGVMFKHGQEEVPRLNKVAGVPDRVTVILDNLINWCTQRSWQQRPSSAQLASILTDLKNEDFATVEQVLASCSGGTAKTGSRIKLPVFMFWATLVLFIVIGAVTLWSHGRGSTASDELIQRSSLSAVIGFAEHAKPVLSDAQSEDLVARWEGLHPGARPSARECLRLADQIADRRPATALRIASEGLDLCAATRVDPVIVCGLGAMKFKKLHEVKGSAAAEKFVVDSIPAKLFLVEPEAVSNWNAALLCERIGRAAYGKEKVRLASEYCRRYTSGNIFRATHEKVFGELAALVQARYGDDVLLATTNRWVAARSQDCFLMRSLPPNVPGSYLGALISGKRFDDAQRFWKKLSPSIQSEIESGHYAVCLDRMFAASKEWDRAIRYCIDLGQYLESRNLYEALERYRAAVHWQVRSVPVVIPEAVYARIEELLMTDISSDERWSARLVATICEERSNPATAKYGDRLLVKALCSSRYKRLKPSVREELDLFATKGLVSKRIAENR